MDKRIFLTFLCAVTGISAQAQSHVTVYGRFDAGGANAIDENGAGGVRFDDSIDMGSRLGFKGMEDAGGGASIVFVLENGFRLATGGLRHGGALLGRQAFTGLRNPTITVAFGDQYDFIADYTARFNVGAFSRGYAGHQGNFDRFGDERLKNSIKFAGAGFNGFSYGGMYSFGDAAGNARTGRAWSLGTQYANGPLTAGVAYTRLDNPFSDATIYPYAAIGITSALGQTVGVVDPLTGAVTDLYAVTPFPVDSQAVFAVGAQWMFGKFALIGNTTNTTFKGDGRSAMMRAHEVGLRFPFSSLWSTAFGFQHTSVEASRWNRISAGLAYSLSKWVTVHVSGDYLMAPGHMHRVIGYSFAPSDMNRQSDIQIGLRVRF